MISSMHGHAGIRLNAVLREVQGHTHLHVVVPEGIELILLALGHFRVAGWNQHIEILSVIHSHTQNSIGIHIFLD